MHPLRRKILRSLAAGGLFAATLAAGLLRPVQALAAEWNKAAFDATAAADALKSIGATSAIESAQIQVKAPEIAENGAIVPIEVSSRIPGTQTIYLVADKNPQPLAASFDFPDGTEPFVSTRIKMAESSRLRVIVKAADKFYITARDIKVTIGGCGA